MTQRGLRQERGVLRRVVLPSVVLASIAVPQLLVAERLPPALAIHWGLDWRPNGSMPTWLSLVTVVLAWVVAWLTLLRPFERDTTSVDWRGERDGWVVAGLLVAVQTTVVVKNLDAPQWSSARPVSIGNVVMVVAAGVVPRIALTLCWRHQTRDSGQAPARANRRPTRPWQRVLAMDVLPAVFIVIVLGAGAQQWVLACLVAAVLIFTGLIFSTARARVTDSGVEVALGTLGWPRWEIPIASLRGADVIWVEPLAFGGWGWRRWTTADAVVVRRGEALRLKKATGRDLVLTVADADTLAAAINERVALD